MFRRPRPIRFRQALILSLARLWMRSWRLRWPGGATLPDRGVLVLWHEHLPACIPAFAHRGIAVLISRSRDGALAAEACRRLDYRVFRGSTSAGALAGMKALARSLLGPVRPAGRHSGFPARESPGSGLAGMALDGPRGPRRQAQPGSLWLAGLADAALFPVAVKASASLRLKTWDRCLLPLPFAKVEFRIGEACRPADLAEIAAAMESNQAALESRPAAMEPAAVPA